MIAEIQNYLTPYPTETPQDYSLRVTKRIARIAIFALLSLSYIIINFTAVSFYLIKFSQLSSPLLYAFYSLILIGIYATSTYIYLNTFIKTDRYFQEIGW